MKNENSTLYTAQEFTRGDFWKRFISDEQTIVLKTDPAVVSNGTSQDKPNGLCRGRRKVRLCQTGQTGSDGTNRVRRLYRSAGGQMTGGTRAGQPEKGAGGGDKVCYQPCDRCGRVLQTGRTGTRTGQPAISGRKWPNSGQLRPVK